MGRHLETGKLRTPWGEEYMGFKFTFGAKHIVRAKFVAEGEIMKVVFSRR